MQYCDFRVDATVSATKNTRANNVLPYIEKVLQMNQDRSYPFSIKFWNSLIIGFFVVALFY
jgi:hypothetical protein